MAQRVDEAKYEIMIAALNKFASNVYILASEMQTHALACAQILSEEDKAISEIYYRIRDCQIKYSEATNQAKLIAAAMQEELDEQRKEDQVWNSED